MSDFDTVLERLLTDPSFAAALAADPARALAGYHLRPDEVALLHSQVSGDSGGQPTVETRATQSSVFGLVAPLGGLAGLVDGSARQGFGPASEGGRQGFGPASEGGRQGFGPASEGGRQELGVVPEQRRQGFGPAGHPYQSGRAAEPPPPAGYRIQVDADGDGDWDRYIARGRAGGVDILVDLDADGQADFVGHDDDGDGLINSAEYDQDGDGDFEERQYDRNGDGRLDHG